ncbi:MAG: alpha/beta hydrolase [Ferruginibacter sp.]
MVFLCFFLFQGTYAQSISTGQDSNLNNLVHPKDYVTCKPGDLGAIKKIGNASQSMIFIAGLGFGNEDYRTLINHYKKYFTIYEVTPAGFAGTPAPPMPDTSVKYSQLTWTNGIVTGVINLIEKEKLKNPIIVAHFLTATQAALNLAVSYPDKISKLIIISGSPYRYYPGFKDGQFNDWANERIYTPEQRGKLVEAYWAPKWFKTVTKKTWDENMWTPDDYTKKSINGNQLFKKAADVPLQVMIRYLIEWMAYDASEKYKQLKVPTLILIPDFKDQLTIRDTSDKESCTNVRAKQYLKYFHQVSWQKAVEAKNPLIEIQTIPDTRIFMWYDNPKAVYNLIGYFSKH